MSLTFPVLSLNPASISMEPVNKSLIPEDVSNLYASGRELYTGDPYTINLQYKNLPANDTAKLIQFCELVGTILPFLIMIESHVYSVSFIEDYQLSKQIYGFSDISLQLQTNVMSLNKWPSLEKNLAKQWFYLVDYPFFILNTHYNYISNAIKEAIVLYSIVNGERVEVTQSVEPRAGIIYCASADGSAISFVVSATYTLTTKLYWFSGVMPHIAIYSIIDDCYQLNSIRIYPEYREIEFVANSTTGYILIGCTNASHWSLDIELIKKV